MKRLFTIFFGLLLGISLLGAEEFTMGGIYVKDATTNLTCTLISKTTNRVETLAIGKTYHIDADVMEIKTKADEGVSFGFSSGLQVHVAQNSTFSVDAFNQMISNLNGYPSVIVADYSVCSISLFEGDIELVCPKLPVNSQCIIQTSLVNVNVAEGALSIRANPKYVMLNVVEGSVTVVDAKNKKSVIDKGNLGLIIPYPGRDGEIMVTQRPVSADDMSKMTKICEQLEKSQKEMLWTVFNKKVVGVRLK